MAYEPFARCHKIHDVFIAHSTLHNNYIFQSTRLQLTLANGMQTKSSFSVIFRRAENLIKRWRIICTEFNNSIRLQITCLPYRNASVAGRQIYSTRISRGFGLGGKTITSRKTLKYPIRSKQKWQLIDNNKFPFSRPAQRKNPSETFLLPFRVVWCVWLGEIAIWKLWQDGWERENLHNKPFCMQTSQRCQLKPTEQFIKFTSHYWKTCSRVAGTEKKARWHIIYWHIVYNQRQLQPKFLPREKLGRLCRHCHCTFGWFIVVRNIPVCFESRLEVW